MLEVVDAHLTLGEGTRSREVLHGVTLAVHPGEIVSLIGENGCGKSSLASLLCAGRLCSSGRVLVNGIDPASNEAARLEVRRLVGLVQQNPVDQIVSSTVTDEVAFGPRNLGLTGPELQARVVSALKAVGLAGFEKRDTNALSGGEQQRLALAGVLAMQPAYLVLDEATSMLDPASRRVLRELVCACAREQGIGVVQITHEPVELFESDRVVAMGDGKILWSGTPRELLCLETELPGNPFAHNELSEGVRAAMMLGYGAEGTVSPEGAASCLERALRDGALGPADVLPVSRAFAGTAARRSRSDSEPIGPGLVARGLSYSYRAGETVLHALDFEAPAGRVALLAGRSGCGKSTLLTVLSGLAMPDAGKVTVCGEVAAPGVCGMAFQHPESQLFLNSVFDEIALAPRCAGAPEQEVRSRVARAAACIGLDEGLLDRYPFELSGGQARRVALASILSLDAKSYLFDEPTAGLDARGRADMHRLVRTLAERGLPVVVVSHDLAEWLPVADSVALMGSGSMVWQGEAAAVESSPEVFALAGLEPPLNLALAARLGAVGEAAHAC